MNAHQKRILTLAGVGLSVALAGSLQASPTSSHYELIDLGTLGGSSSYAYGMSESGLVVGGARTTADGLQAFLYQGNALVSLGAPDGFDSARVVAVNASGRVAGSVTDPNQREYAYVWDDGVWSAIGSHFGLPYATVSAIDDAGRIAGYSYQLGGDRRAFLWEDGVFTDLPTLGLDSKALGMSTSGLIAGSSRDLNDRGYAVYWNDAGVHNLGFVADAVGSQAYDINDAGIACGTCTFFSPPYFNFDHPSVWLNDEPMLLETPGGAAGSARAINNAGQIVGYVKRRGADPGPALLWEHGVYYELDSLIDPDLGWTLMAAFDINNAGQIAGYGQTPNGQIHAFLLLPAACPEDLTGDGFVGQEDLGALLAAFGVDDGGDIDGDGDTDQADLGALLGAYGSDCP